MTWLFIERNMALLGTHTLPLPESLAIDILLPSHFPLLHAGSFLVVMPGRGGWSW